MNALPKRAARYFLDGHVSCVSEARSRVRAFLAAASPPAGQQEIETAALAASELVSNAVLHAPGPCVLRLSDDGEHLRVEVSDSSGRLPVVRDTDLREGEGGAGLRLLKALASDVEVSVHPTGKTVSVTLDRSAYRQSA